MAARERSRHDPRQERGNAVLGFCALRSTILRYPLEQERPLEQYRMGMRGLNEQFTPHR